MISVLIPFHLNENQEYLDLCLKSLERQNVNMEVIVIAGCEKEPMVPSWVKLDHSTETSSYAHKINRGVSLSNPLNQYLMFAQDDLIFGKDSIRNLIGCLRDYAMLLNPISNCDNHFLYEADLKVQKGEELLVLERFMKMNQIKGFEEEIMNMEGSPNKLMFPVKINYLYCTILARHAWNLIGPMDENYVNGCEDTDYCMRAKQKNIACSVTPNAFVFHFGGATTSKVKLESTEKNYERFIAKWGWDPRKP